MLPDAMRAHAPRAARRRASWRGAVALALLALACTTTFTADEMADQEEHEYREVRTPCDLSQTGDGCLEREAACIQDPDLCPPAE